MERLIAVHFPLTNQIILSKTKKKCGVTLVIAGSLALYSFNLVTTGSEASVSLIHECVPLEKWIRFTKYMTLVDTVVTIFVPFALISLINLAIGAKLTKCGGGLRHLFRHRQAAAAAESARQSSSAVTNTNQTRLNASPRMSSPSVKFFASNIEASASITELSPLQQHQQHQHRLRSCDFSMIRATRGSPNLNGLNRRRKYSRATLVLLSISTSFLVLNFPIALCKVLFSFETKPAADSLLSGQTASSSQHAMLDHILGPMAANNKSNSSSTYAEMNQHAALIDPLEYLMDKMTTNLHYLNYVLNFFLYSLNGAKFRKSVVRLFTCG